MAARTKVTAVAVLPALVSPFPRYYRVTATHKYRGNTAFFQFGPHYRGNYRGYGSIRHRVTL